MRSLGAVALLAAMSWPAQAQDSLSRLIEVAREVMAAAGNCALITRSEDGTLRVRAMDPFPPEGELVVWMATNAGTRKVAELRADPRASLYYFDREGGGYVTLIGSAEVIADDEQRRRLWKPEWEPFYEDANRGDDYVLIRFATRRAEIVSLRHGVAADPRAWKPAIVELDGR